MFLWQIVAEVGDVVAAIMLLINHIGVGDDGKEGERAVGDAEPINSRFSLKRRGLLRLGSEYGFIRLQDKGLGVEMGDIQ